MRTNTTNSPDFCPNLGKFSEKDDCSRKILLSLPAIMSSVVRLARMLMALAVVFLAVVINWQESDLAFEQQAKQDLRYAETQMSAPKHHHHEATLTDATSLYRVCSSRPQRLLPTHGSKTERTASPCGFVRRNIVKPFHFLHDSRRRQETAPYCLSASCLYYVIALRHIIR